MGGKWAGNRIMLFDRHVVLDRASENSIQAFDERIHQPDHKARPHNERALAIHGYHFSTQLRPIRSVS